MTSLDQELESLSPEQRRLVERWLREQPQPESPAGMLRRRATDVCPLSFAQQQLWFLHQWDPTSIAYHFPIAVRLQGPCDVATLARSLQAIVQRHEALRTTFRDVDGRPQQVLAACVDIPLHLVDLEHLPGAARELQVELVAHAQAAQSFDLIHGPLLYTRLLRLDAREHVLLITIHHIVFDGWSRGVLMRELFALYKAFGLGQVSPLPTLPIQYGDYAVWQRQHLQGRIAEDQLAFWSAQLRDAPPLLELPTDYPRPTLRTAQGADYIFLVPAAVTERLSALSRQAGATLFMTLLAAFDVLLARYSGQDDIVVGTPIAGRTQAELEGLIGLFVNMLALRLDLSGNPPFQELVERARTVALAAYAHQDVAFEQVLDALALGRDPSRHPVFQTTLALQNAPMPALESAGLTMIPLELARGIARYDLGMFFWEGAQGLRGRVEYRTDLFTPATIQRMCEQFTILLAGIVANPQQRFELLPLLSAAEREQLLVTWNATQIPYRQDASLHMLVAAQVARTPDAVAVVFDFRDKQTGRQADKQTTGRTTNDGSAFSLQLTYAELNQRANQLAQHLRALGVGPEARVGIFLERSAELVIALLGVLKAGAAYLPLDPDYPRERLALMLEDARAPVLITATNLQDKETGRQADKEIDDLLVCLSPCLEMVVDLRADWPLIAQRPTTPPDSSVAPDNLAYVIYTSGSTGMPKGVMNTHRAIVNRLRWMQDTYQLGANDRILQKTPFSFDVSVWEFFWPLLAGAQLTIARPDGHKHPAYLVRVIAEQRITMLHFVPSMLRLFLEEPALSDCGTLRWVISSGEALPHALQERFFARLDAELHNLYGPTEAAIDVTAWDCERTSDRRTVPIGRPIANTQIYLLDRHMNPVPIGVLGEIYIGGVQLARGYLGRPDLTAERFVPNPWGSGFRVQGSEEADRAPEPRPLIPEPSPRLYRTGDRAYYRPDGSIEYLGRIDHQIKLRGFRIELGEIEATLLRHPAVREASVLLREDRPGALRLVAYVVPIEDERPKTKDEGRDTLSCVSTSDLRAFLANRLPDYMIPSVFVTLDALPLTPNGKLDRKRLPTPDDSHTAQDTAFVAPRTPTEHSLAAIWQQVLGVAQVGIHDNFFALGGDSILSIQIIARARQIGLRLDPKQIFQHQTIAALATVAAVAPVVEPDQGLISGALPLTPIQHWFFAQPHATPQHWNQAILLMVHSSLNPVHLSQALRRLVLHHDALRMRFTPTPQGWQQHNHHNTAVGLPLSWLDLSALPLACRPSAITGAANELHTRLELTQGPLGRVAYFDLGANQPARLLLVLHHLIVDGVSWRVLLEDLQTAYQQIAAGQNVALPPKTSSFHEWAHRLADHAQHDALLAELAYWRAQPWTQVVPLPLDIPSTAGVHTMADMRRVAVALDIDETQALLHAVPPVYHTQIDEVLLTALALTLADWTGEMVLLVDREGHGREPLFDDLDLSRTVGWFTLIAPLLLDLRGADGSGAALKTIKEQVRHLPQHGIGYGLLRYLAVDTTVQDELRALPQAEILFNYLGQLDQVLAESALFAPAPEASGSAQSPQAPRRYLLEINSSVFAEQLQISVGYSLALHQPATIERFAEAFCAKLRGLIAHCLSPLAGGYTPSDFPQLALDQAALDQLLATLPPAAGAAAPAQQWIEDIYPLAPMQAGMLFHHLYDPGSGLYIEQLGCTIEGQLDQAAFERAWTLVFARHTVLRTAFVWEGLAQPLQVVYEQVALPLKVEDWSELPSSEQEAQLAAYRADDRARSFNLRQVPLLRLALIRLAEARYALVWTHHHILLDGWCLPVLLNEVLRCYAALCQDAEPELPLNVPYSTYIAWLARQNMAAAEAYWREMLAGFDVPTLLPLDQGVGQTRAAAADQYAEAQIWLPATLTTQLHMFAREQHLTLNTLVQGAWARLLGGYSGTRDVVFGATVAGRPSELPGIEAMIGLFINTLPVRVVMPLQERVGVWLHGLQAQQAELRQYEYSPLAAVQAWSAVPRGQALFASLVIFENYPTTIGLLGQASGLTIQGIAATERTNYPLTLTAVERDAQLLLHTSYQTHRFEAVGMTRLLEQLAVVLEGMAADAERPIGDLPLLTDQERTQVLVQWNATTAAYPADMGLHQFVAAQVARTPDAVALIFGEQHLTYAELEQRANQLAHWLATLGVGPEIVVAICLARSPELAVALLGVLKSSAAYLTLDPATPSDRLAFVLADVQAAALIVATNLSDGNLATWQADKLIADQQSTWSHTVVIDLHSHAEAISRMPLGAPMSRVTPDNAAYVIYTSGSTGQPKGVLVTHHAIVNRLRWAQAHYPLTEIDRVLQQYSFSFDASICVFFWPLVAGAGVVMARPGGQIDSAYLVRLIGEEQITIIDVVPTLLHMLLDEPGISAGSALRHVFCGGEALPAELAARFFSSFAAALSNHYGPTEAAVDVAWWECERGSSDAMIPIGRPIANTQLYLLDHQMEPVPIGAPGELYIGGAGLARGYLGRPDLTAERFVPNPWGSGFRVQGSERPDRAPEPRPLIPEPSPRLYRTGDLARYRSDGNIEFLGRLDQQVKLRGFRIELGEIEVVLAQHPGVGTCAVVMREDTTTDRRLIAFVVPAEVEGRQMQDESKSSFISRHSSLVSDLRRFITTRLPEYMLPAAFVLLDALPLTPSGKIDRRALPAPDGERSSLDRPFVAPRIPSEQQLVAIWRELLHVDQIGVYDTFFELGGHSLVLTQLASRIKQTFRVEIPLAVLFEARTVAAMVEAITAGKLAQEEPLELDLLPEDDPDRITPMSYDRDIPLSFAQQRLWFLEQLAPGAATYIIPAAVRLSGSLDLVALGRSFTTIAARHAVWRTTFTMLGDQPVQQIAARAALPLRLFDLQALPLAARSALSTQLSRQAAQHPFDLVRGPLVRLTLLRLEPHTHVLLLSMHHIIADGWSVGLILQELAVLYPAYTSGHTPRLPALPIQYTDFALWQQRHLTGAKLDAQLAYWRSQLAELPPLELPLDYPRPPIQSDRGAHLRQELPPTLTSALYSLSQQHDTTLFMTLLAGFAALLARYSRQNDLAIGSPIAGRTRPEIEGLIGFFVNTLALRVDLRNGPSFQELLERVKAICLAAYTYQDLPFERLVEALQPTRDMSRHPLVQVVFVLQNAPTRPLVLPDLTIQSLPVESPTAKFDLTLAFAETTTGLVGNWEYTTDLFEASTITRLSRHFVIVLEGIVADPRRPVMELPLMSRAEHYQILVDWNATACDHPQEAAVHQLFKAQAARTPDTVAVVFGNQCLTYAELDRRSNQLAYYLQSLQIGPEACVGIYLERSVDLVVGLLGVLKAGAAYLPLDPTYPAARLAFMLADSQAALLLTRSELCERLGEHATPVLCLDRAWPSIVQQPTHALRLPILTEQLAYVIYTSGSTGRPKGVQISHAGLTNLVIWHQRAFALSSADRASMLAGLGFDASVWELWPYLATGASLHLVRDELRSTPEQLRDWLVAHKITLGFLPTPLAERVIGLDWPAGVALRMMLTGGDALQQAPPTTLPFILVNNYGPTENTVVATSGLLASHLAGSSPPPIGRPIANTQVYLLDAQLHPVPIGVAGELYIGGMGLARGYLGRPDLTAERFVPNPFAEVSGIGYRVLGAEPSDTRYPTPGTRLYKTGDLARYRPDGNIKFLGRVDQQVKLRGYRIEPGEIAAALREHVAVQEALVLAREDVSGERRLVAYVVPAEMLNAERRTMNGPDRSSSAFSVQRSALVGELRAFLAERLPEYMIPSAFVWLDALPLTPSGKIDRKALPAPDLDAMRSVYEPPHTPTEELLAGIWAALLGHSRIGRDDNFFELGGHSLLATQVIARVREAFGVELPLRSLFAFPTVAGLAAHLATLHPDAQLARPPLIPVPRLDVLPLSFAQERLWFLDQLVPNSPLYNIPSTLRLSGALDLLALWRSAQVVVARHETLRTTFGLHHGLPFQQIAPAAAHQLLVVDLTALFIEQRELLGQALAQQAAWQPFDLARGPLLRVALLRLAADEHVLLLTMHHIISDGWSMGVLVREVVACYAAFHSGAEPVLPILPIQYADYALWQREWLQGRVLDAQLSYWKTQLADVPALLDLPTDRPRRVAASYVGASLPLTLGTATALQRLSRQAGTTLFMTLLAAFQVLLARYSGQDDIVVGTPIANRTQAASEGLIGFFVNMLVLRSKLAVRETFTTLLAQVRTTCLDAYAHQDLPFEQLVDALQPVRDLSTSPLFQVMFTLQNTPQELLELNELRLRPLGSTSAIAQFDITFALSETAHGLSGALEYKTDLFDAATIARLAGHYQTLLAGIALAPDRRLADLPLITAAERQQLLVDWNATNDERAPQGTLHGLFEARAAQTPDALAVICDDEHLSYRALNERADLLARFLSVQGAGSDIAIGLCVERSSALAVGMLGILKAGSAVLPLDPEYPQQRRALMLNDARVPIVIGARSRDEHQTTEGGVASDEIARHASQLIDLDADWPAITRAAASPLPPRAEPLHLAYIFYTSGSTGAPKGVQLPHAALLNYVHAVAPHFALDPGDRVLQFAALGFDVVIEELFPTWAVGAAVVFHRAGLLAPADTFGRLLDDQQVTAVELPAAYWHAWIDDLARADLRPPRSLRLVVLGCEQPERAHLAAWQRYAIPLIYVFGLTETAITSTLQQIDPNRDGGAAVVPIGSPLANMQCYVLDEQMQSAPIGVPGELYIGGIGLARGYLGLPDLTAERFVPNPFTEVSGAGCWVSEDKLPDTRYPTPGTRLYKTGDLARWLPGGVLEFLGRRDQQVKLRGYRIELGEVEAVLAQHEGVREVVVLLREDTLDVGWLVAYVVPTEDEGRRANDQGADSPFVPRPSAFVQELRAFLQERLPGYMLPSAFVVLEALPLTINGKVDRKALPVPEQDQDLGGYIPPGTVTEELLAGIWATVLGRERVGATDNFFELGGHSLLAMQVVARVREVFAVELPLRDLFTAPTVRDLVAKLYQEQQATDRLAQPPLLPQPRGAVVPLSFAQERLWFLEQLTPGLPSYNIPLALHLHGQLDLTALRRSINTIVRRHDALRTTFAIHDDRPTQQIAPPAPVLLPLLDLDALPPAIQLAGAQQLAQTEAQCPFDLQRGPLVRVTLVRMSATEHLLVVILHHIISDGWSMGVIVRELTALYSAYREGTPASLPMLPIQYADYALWQREWLEGEVLRAQLSYWTEQLREPRATLDLPLARSRPPVQTFAGALATLNIDAALIARLQALSRQAGATLFMTLLAGFDVLLYRYSGQDDILVGSPIANRTRPELEELSAFS